MGGLTPERWLRCLQAAAPQGVSTSGAWQVLYTPDGKAYYHNPSTGSTQWEAPPGLAL